MGKKRNGKNFAGRRKKGGEGRRGAAVNLHYKDTVFRMLFREKKMLLSLYNAVSGKDYNDPEDLEIITLENAIYMGMKNDLAFLVDLDLYLFEHQSTVNKNMPLRFLQYVTAEYSKLTVLDNLYAGRLVKIPAPHFVVFYNGATVCAERDEIKLSDAFQVRENEPELELRVQVLNINAGFNENLKEQCRTLEEYMQYVDKVRAYANDMEIEMAVDKAIDECISQNILREFLLKNKAEVKRMSIYEYDEETTRRAISENAYERGVEQGEFSKMVSLVCKKMKRDMSLGEIAEDLEEEISVIEPIYHAAKECAPEYDPDAVIRIIDRVREEK